MKLDLHYGKKLISLQIPEINISQVVQPWQLPSQTGNTDILRQAVTSMHAQAFTKLIGGKRLCVLTEDGTRETPSADIFAGSFALLSAAARIRFIIATGTHNSDTPENRLLAMQIEKAARAAGINDFAVHAHDYRRDACKHLGTTTRGTNIIASTLADDPDVFLVFSDMKTHYFAGYSNPIKNFVPGICAFETTEKNHSLALHPHSSFGLHPWHSDPKRRINPLADDQLEAMQMVVKNRPVYAMVTLSTAGKIQWARFGPVQPVTTEAMDQIDRWNTHTVTPVSRLIVSPGGFPNDISLYIAQRALELTGNAILDRGEILFLAACRDGVGEPQTLENFYNRLTNPLDQILKSIESDYKLYSHKPYKFAQMILRLRKIWLCSEIPDNLIEPAHLCPTHNPQQIVDSWLAEDPSVKILIADGANKIALYAK
jgi:nickel-dependent lactate racemase